MKDLPKSCRAAVVQAAPVLFDKERTIEKAAWLIKQAAKQGAGLILFPESFIPAYPRGLSFGLKLGSRTMEGREDWRRYYDNSVMAPGKDLDLIAQAAKEAHAYVCMGITERDPVNFTLYCTIVYFGPDGAFLGKHRKVKPTALERCVWGEDDGSTLTAIPTEYGVVGGLICWENYMPLARYAMYEKGVGLYMAPTADSRDGWQATMRHIALEGRCYVLGCNQFVTKDMYPQDLKTYGELEESPDLMCPGGSCIVDPFGEYVAGPVWNKEEMLVADLDLNKIVLSRMDFDPCGHYSRPDIFHFKVVQPQNNEA